MAASGTPFETPRACPFVALELDRDKRSDRPDYRHRCFAEPTPAPRSIAHQEAYCLSPGFAACPVFQDWAVRAAARPSAGATGASASSGPAMVGGPATDAAAATGADMAAGAAAAGPASTDEAAADLGGLPADQEPMTTQPTTDSLPEDVSVAPIAAAGLAAAAAPTFATTGWDDEAHDNEQLGAFDSSTAGAMEPPYDVPHSSYGEPDAGYPELPESPAVPAPPAPTTYDDHDAAAAAMPAFLVGRSTRPATTPATSPLPSRASPTPSRDEIVPSWEIDGRYGAEGPENPGGGRLDGILTAIAVVAILALGVAAVVFLPGLLNRGGTSKTPTPSFVVPSGLSTALPTALPTAGASTPLPATGAPTVAPSSAGPTTAPTLEASQRTYRIKPGDTLAHIANKFKVTVADILAANPSITDPNHILIGVLIVIPASPTPTAAPSASP